MGTHPRCVHTPTTTSHSGFCARSVSACGSRSSPLSTATSFSISAGVRRRMNTGLPRHLTVTVWPTSILLRSTSSDASASTSADALIDSRNFSTTSRSALA